MELHPIQSFNQMSTKQKVATVAGATVATAAIASVPLAYVKGKGAGEEKLLEAIKAGYKKIGASISEQFTKIKEGISKKEAPAATEKTEAAAAEKVEVAAEGAVNKTEAAAKEEILKIENVHDTEPLTVKSEGASNAIGSAMAEVVNKGAEKKRQVISTTQIVLE